LGFAFFVARDVGRGPIDEFLEAGFAIGGHGVRIQEKAEGDHPRRMVARPWFRNAGEERGSVPFFPKRKKGTDPGDVLCCAHGHLPWGV
jgi:hypothetical protein